MHGCDIGEFGIVYKGHIVKDPGPVVTDVVAIKTLKGIVTCTLLTLSSTLANHN